jgi:hypothetical protein
MKIVVIFLFVLIFGNFKAYSQEQNTEYFGQGLFQITNIDTLKAVEAQIRANSEVIMARLDNNTQRFFIITNEPLNEQKIKSWFGNYSNTIWCVYIGVRGVDPLRAFPFDCEN